MPAIQGVSGYGVPPEPLTPALLSDRNGGSTGANLAEPYQSNPDANVRPGQQNRPSNAREVKLPCPMLGKSKTLPHPLAVFFSCKEARRPGVFMVNGSLGAANLILGAR